MRAPGGGEAPEAVPEWGVVVPVKRLIEAKTRLRGAAPGVPHERLVLALAQDTVRAVLACPVVGEVLVVTDDPAAAERLAAEGARVIPDAPAAGLNAALAYGAAQLTGRPWVGQLPGRPWDAQLTGRPWVAQFPGRPWVAVLTADLPALRPAELAGALREAVTVQARGFVPDAAGSGTTLLAVPPGGDLDPRFGPGSAAKHAASGARRLDGDWPSLRRDVDTVADLSDAARLGLGPYTTAAWREPAR